jgi:hypothetical protein
MEILNGISLEYLYVRGKIGKICEKIRREEKWENYDSSKVVFLAL